MIKAAAPVRICDNGGWTDTWFGGPGRVLNIAVTPGVEVSITRPLGPDPVVFGRGDLRRPVPHGPGGRPGWPATRCSRWPSTLTRRREDLAVEVSVRSAVPAGCGTGTSAAVAVAMLGGLAALRSGGTLHGRGLAYAAHRLEVEGSRCREWDPGSIELGVRRNQLHRGRALP